jgi:hypothetical protein
MKLAKLKDFYRGWFIGNFEPSIHATDYYECGILSHKKSEVWPKHYHKIATEINVLIEGSMTICGKEIFKDDIFILHPGEIADPVFHEDCKILCIKMPSIPSDKYEIVQATD